MAAFCRGAFRLAKSPSRAGALIPSRLPTSGSVRRNPWRAMATGGPQADTMIFIPIRLHALQHDLAAAEHGIDLGGVALDGGQPTLERRLGERVHGLVQA